MLHYSREEACRAWLTQVRLGYVQLRDLMQTYDRAEAVYDAVMRGEKTVSEMITTAQLHELRTFGSRDAMHEMLLLMQKADMQIMSMQDANYPQQLLDINDPPVFLYWKGDPACLNNRCITMVGTRKATLDALDATERIARRLS